MVLDMKDNVIENALDGTGEIIFKYKNQWKKVKSIYLIFVISIPILYLYSISQKKTISSIFVLIWIGSIFGLILVNKTKKDGDNKQLRIIGGDIIYMDNKRKVTFRETEVEVIYVGEVLYTISGSRTLYNAIRLSSKGQNKEYRFIFKRDSDENTLIKRDVVLIKEEFKDLERLIDVLHEKGIAVITKK